MTSSWQQPSLSHPLQRSLEEITQWIDSEQSLPLNGGTASTREFLSGWFTGCCKESSVTEQNMQDTNKGCKTNSSFPSCKEGQVSNVDEEISEMNQQSVVRSSVSFVPIAPAISTSHHEQCLKHNSGRAAFSDEFLNEVTDLSGTTANRGRKMTPRERDIMLFKRKLRNRDSASRSRKKKKMIMEEMNKDFESLIEFCKSKEKESDRLLSEVERKKVDLLDERRCLVKELESLGAELRNAKEQLKQRESIAMEKCSQRKEVSFSADINDGFRDGRIRQRAPLGAIDSERRLLEPVRLKSSRLIRS